MTTEEYKKLFKGFPERAWLSSSLHKVLNSQDYGLILKYLNGTEDIEEVNSIEELYRIKSIFFQLLADCSLIIENIKKLDLDFIGEFTDKTMNLHEIGISPNDIFVCKKDFLHWEMVQINSGSEIRIKELKYAGKNSTIVCEFVKHNTNKETKHHFPDSSEIKLLLTLQELKEYFEK